MNFNSLINKSGIKGSRRGGNVKEMAGKAATATKEVTMKAAFGVAGILPATNNKVNAIAHESVTRDRELLHEIGKNRAAIDELRAALGMPPVPVSTKEEIIEAVTRMEEAEAAAAVPAKTMKEKLQGVFQKEQVPVETPVMEEEVVEQVEEPVLQPTPAGATRKFVSSPGASTYDYSNISEQA